MHSAIIKNSIKYQRFTRHYMYGETMFPNQQYSQWKAQTFLLSKLNAIMLLLLFLVLIFLEKQVKLREKVIKALKIHHCISQSHQGSCVLFVLRKYLCKHLEVSIFLCSLGAEEEKDPPLEEKRKTGESNPVTSAVRVNIAGYSRGGRGGRQDFLLSPPEQQFPSALSFNFKVEFVLYCRPISTLGAWLVGA